MQQAEFAVDPFIYIAGDEEDRARRSLEVYFGGYSGRTFDRLAQQSDGSRFTANDIVAAMTLAVTPSGKIAAWLLDQPEKVVAALQAVSTSTRLDQDPDVIRHDGLGGELWNLLRDEAPDSESFGAVTRSKILAAKRPQLFPIKDRVLVKALTGRNIGGVNNWWDMWAERMSKDDAGYLLDSAEKLSASLSLDNSVSALRVLDVVIWMREWGWRQARRAEDMKKLADYEQPIRIP